MSLLSTLSCPRCNTDIITLRSEKLYSQTSLLPAWNYDILSEHTNFHTNKLKISVSESLHAATETPDKKQLQHSLSADDRQYTPWK